MFIHTANYINLKWGFTVSNIKTIYYGFMLLCT